MPVILRGVLPFEVPPSFDPNRFLINHTGTPAGIKKLSESICCFVHSDELHLEEPMGPVRTASIKTEVLALRSEMRYRGFAAAEVTRKKDELVDLLASSPGDKARIRPLVEKLPWPDFMPNATTNAVTVVMRPDMQNLISPGLATGFAIRRGLVATAAHVVERFFVGGRGNELEDMKVIFGLSDSAGTYFAWDIKRVIHSTGATVSGPIDDPQRLEVDPSLSYPDFAVLELDVPDGVHFPPPLVLQKYPATKGLPVHAIGHPGGAPLVGVKNGQITATTEVTRDMFKNQAFKQGTLGIELDSFPGNSGGPIMRADDNRVVGLFQCAFNPGFALALYIDPTDRSKLDTALRRLVTRLFGSSAQARQLVDSFSRRGFTDNFSQLCLYSGNSMPRSGSNTWTLSKVPSTSVTIAAFEKICRSDIAAHLNGSFKDFTIQSPDVMNEDRKHPGGEVNIALSVKLLPGTSNSARLPYNLRLHLHYRSFEGADGGRPEIFRYTFDAKPGMGLADSFRPSEQVRLPVISTGESSGEDSERFLRAKEGLYGWTAITVSRVSRDVVAEGTEQPAVRPPPDNTQPRVATGSIRVEYKFSGDRTAAWHSRFRTGPGTIPLPPPALYFTTTLTFNEVQTARTASWWDERWDHDSPTWIAFIGSRDPAKSSEAVWRGPLEESVWQEGEDDALNFFVEGLDPSSLFGDLSNEEVNVPSPAFNQ